MTKAMRAQVSLIPQYAMSALNPDLIADAARAPAGQDGAARGGAGPAPPLVPVGPEHLVAEAER